MIPRITGFKSSTGMKKAHIVLVNGDEYKSRCSRKVLKNGEISHNHKITCETCLAGGWIKFAQQNDITV